MTRAMGAGKPVVVYRHGSFAEPPAGSGHWSAFGHF